MSFGEQIIRKDELRNVLIQRIFSVRYGRNVISKSSLFHDPVQNILLEREHDFLKRIHSDSSNINSDDSQSIPIFVIEDTSLPELSVKTNSQRVAKPLGMHLTDLKQEIVSEDIGGNALQSLMKTNLSLLQKTTIMLYLVEALEECHKCSIVYRNLQPENVLVAIDMSEIVTDLQIYDFRFSIDMEDRANDADVEQDDRYISPEDTGRTEGTVDYRSDIYSLGILCWEMFVGHHPFKNNDDLIYCHLAKEVDMADKTNRSVPTPIAKVIQKMCNKDKSLRYQNCLSLKNDLRFLLDEMDKEKTDEGIRTSLNKLDFKPCAMEQSLELQIGNPNWSRQRQLFDLENHLNLVIERNEKSIVVLKGFPKSGRSALVDALQSKLRLLNVLILKQTLPSKDHIMPAFAPLIEFITEYLTTQPEKILGVFLQKLRKHLGEDNLSLFVHMFPEFGSLCPARPRQLKSDEALKFYVLSVFFETFAKLGSERLIFYMKDISATDPSSRFVLHFFGKTIMRPCIFILDYDDMAKSAEVVKPIMETFPDCLFEIEMQPLDQKDVHQYLRLLMYKHSGDLSSLAQLLCVRCGGSPSNITDALKQLVNDQIIAFNDKSGEWSVDIEMAGKTINFTSLGLEMVISKVDMLNSSERNILYTAVILGFYFEKTMLQEDVTCDSLNSYLKKFDDMGIIKKCKNMNVTGFNNSNRTGKARKSILESQEVFQFTEQILHNQLLQHIPKATKAKLVEKIILSSAGANDCPDLPENILAHLNEVLDAIADPRISRIAFKLNIEAILAKSGTDFESKLDATFLLYQRNSSYFWKELESMTFKMLELYCLVKIQKESMTLKTLELLEDKMLEHCHSMGDILALVKLKASFYQSQNDHTLVVQYLKQTLEQTLGYSFDTSAEAIDQQERALEEICQGKSPSSIISQLKKVKAKEDDQISSILTILLYSVKICRMFDLSFLVSTKVCIETIKKCSVPESCSASFYVMARKKLSKSLKTLNPNEFNWWSDLAQRISLEDPTLDKRIATIIGLKGMSIVWPTDKLLFMLSSTWKAETERTPSFFFGRFCERFMFSLVSLGIPFDVCTNYMKTDNKTILDRIESQSISKCVEYLSEPNAIIDNIAVFFKTNLYFKLFHRILYADPVRNEYLTLLPKIEYQLTGTLMHIDSYLFEILLHVDYNTPVQHSSLKEMEILVNFQKSKENYCKLHLAKAEFLKQQGKFDESFYEYESAMETSTGVKNYWILAFASERYAELLLQKKLNRIAKSIILTSYSAYETWGCLGKLQILKSKYASYIETVDAIETSISDTYSRKTSIIDGRVSLNQKLDVNTLLEVTASINKEKNFERLLNIICVQLMKHSGASKTVIAINDLNVLHINAECVIDNGGVLKFETIKVPIQSYPNASAAIMNYVFRSKKSQLFNSSLVDKPSQFQNDPYIVTEDPKSVFCCPMMHHGSTTGVIYLENKFQPGAFTPRKVEIIESLLSSASISLANASLVVKNQELAQALTGKTDAELKSKLQLDAPIAKVMETINEIKSKFLMENAQEEVSKLDTALKILMSEGLFEIAQDESIQAMDNDAKSWLTTVARRSSLFEEEELPTASPETQNSISGEYQLEAELKILEYLKIGDALQFDALAFYEISDHRPLYYMSISLFQKYKIFETFSIKYDNAKTFFRKVESSYNDVPYHSSTHSCDLLKVVESLFFQTDLEQKFTFNEKFALIIAGAIHDMDHPGVNNNFLIQTNHPMATLYNDHSVLESHHVSRAFELARDKDCNIFQGFSKDQFAIIRNLIIELVLATDLSQHFPILNKFKGKQLGGAISLEDKADRTLILQMVIKLGDLNNPTKIVDQSLKWTFRVMEEFFKQGDLERQANLPITKFMDRNDTNIPKCQIGFIDVLVEPLFDIWTSFSQTDFTLACKANLLKTRDYWKEAQTKNNGVVEFQDSSTLVYGEVLEMDLPHITFNKYKHHEPQKRKWSMQAPMDEEESRSEEVHAFGSSVHLVLDTRMDTRYTTRHSNSGVPKLDSPIMRMRARTVSRPSEPNQPEKPRRSSLATNM